MKAPRMTDTTLRDGSHAMRHQFTRQQVRSVAEALDRAGVPVLEVTHGDGLAGSSIQYGFSRTNEMDLIEEVVREKEGPEAVYHKLRARKSASRRYVEFHLLMPGGISVKDAHDRCSAIETEIHGRLPRARVTIHVEPRETGGV